MNTAKRLYFTIMDVSELHQVVFSGGKPAGSPVGFLLSKNMIRWHWPSEMSVIEISWNGLIFQNESAISKARKYPTVCVKADLT